MFLNFVANATSKVAGPTPLRTISTSAVSCGGHRRYRKRKPIREHHDEDGKLLWTIPPPQKLPPRGPILYPSMVQLADSTHFSIMQTAPKKQFELTRDTTNTPLWQFRATGSDAWMAEQDTSGRLGRFTDIYGQLDVDQIEGKSGSVGKKVKVTKKYITKKGKKRAVW